MYKYELFQVVVLFILQYSMLLFVVTENHNAMLSKKILDFMVIVHRLLVHYIRSIRSPFR